MEPQDGVSFFSPIQIQHRRVVTQYERVPQITIQELGRVSQHKERHSMVLARTGRPTKRNLID